MNELTRKIHTPKPEWLKIKIPSGKNVFKIKKYLEERNLHTICQDAKCPNMGECWNKNHATFLIMGNTCSRNCLFCSVNTGRCEPIDINEPEKIAEMAEIMKLDYVVITSVTRDDLPDGGAAFFAEVVSVLKSRFKELKIEVLIPDFKGNPSNIDTVLNSKPDIINHNIETVRNLYKTVNRRPENYELSMSVLKHSSKNGFITKSGIMVGLGESISELENLFDDLIKNGVDILTIGQYLQPTPENLPVKKYYHPSDFSYLKEIAESKGFSGVVSGPFVRSSYNAMDLYKKVAG
ncbi:MAG: lipoyl synthase [Acidobacteriota bacterium]